MCDTWSLCSWRSNNTIMSIYFYIFTPMVTLLFIYFIIKWAHHTPPQPAWQPCCKRQSLQATWAKVTNCFNSTKGNCTRTIECAKRRRDEWSGGCCGRFGWNGNVLCNPFLAFALDNFLLRFAAVSLAAVSFLSFVHDISAFLISPGTTKGIPRMMTAICGWSWQQQQQQ